MMKIGFLSQHFTVKERASAKLANDSLVWLAFSSGDELQEALRRSDVIATFLPLKTIPTIRDETTVAAAVLRVAAAYHLLVAPEGLEEMAILKLKKNAVISVKNALEAAQICDYRPDIQTVYGRESGFEASLALEYDLNEEQILAKAATIKLDETEFIAAPAEGLFVLLCAKNKLEAVRSLRQFNDAKLVEISNIERRVLQLIGDLKATGKLGVRCACDKNGNYHLWACWCEQANLPPNYIKISQSTRTGLAEAAVKKLGF
ncbi:MAG: hypothetical protein RI894_895 [Bacteroidota bacterium]|jgi:porphobilinogen deaminase